MATTTAAAAAVKVCSHRFMTFFRRFSTLTIMRLMMMPSENRFERERETALTTVLGCSACLLIRCVLSHGRMDGWRICAPLLIYLLGAPGDLSFSLSIGFDYEMAEQISASATSFLQMPPPSLASHLATLKREHLIPRCPSAPSNRLPHFVRFSSCCVCADVCTHTLRLSQTDTRSSLAQWRGGKSGQIKHRERSFE